MHAQRIRIRRIERVVPRSGGQLHNVREHPVVEYDAGEARAAIVEHPHHVAGRDLPRRCGTGMHPERFPTTDLRRLAGGAVVQLTVQAGTRLVRDQMQRELSRARSAEPFVRFVPGGVARTIVVVETVDVGGEDLDAPAGCAERKLVRVVTEILKQGQVVLGPHPHVTATPELVELGGITAVGEHETAPLLVQMLDPLP